MHALDAWIIDVVLVFVVQVDATEAVAEEVERLGQGHDALALVIGRKPGSDVKPPNVSQIHATDERRAKLALDTIRQVVMVTYHWHRVGGENDITLDGPGPSFMGQ